MNRFELPGLWLNPSELHGLLATEQPLESIQPGLLKPYIGPLKTRIRQLLGQGGLDSETLDQRIQVRPIAHRHLETEAFGQAAEAVLHRKRLHFDYRSRSRDEMRQRHVSPQRLIHYRNNWYLAAHCHDADDLRLFSLDRIRDPRPDKTPALDIDPATLDRQLEANFGIFTGPQTIGRCCASRRKRPAGPPSSAGTPDQIGQWKDGHYELQIPYGDPTELIREILAWSAEVEVLAPELLRKRVRERLVSAADRYSAGSGKWSRAKGGTA